MEDNPNKMKFCDVGRHSVPVLFHSRKPDRPSCCKMCYRPKVGDVFKEPEKVIDGKTYQSTYRVTKITKTRPTDRTISTLLNALEIVFNRWIRVNKGNDNMNGESFFTCTCCGDIYHKDEMDAGHMFPKTYSGTRFHEDNVWPQSKKCNQLEYGNVEQFKERVRFIIGSKRFDALERFKNMPVKWDKTTILELIKKYKS